MDITVALTAMDCPSCAVIFAVPDRLDKERREDGHAFYCPNGHSMSYSGEITKLRARLKDAERDREWFKEAERHERETRQLVERRLAATKGAVTKLRRRVIAGLCPFGCRRHFTNLERHVASRHPGQELPAEAAE
jgi:hypothetical protein